MVEYRRACLRLSYIAIASWYLISFFSCVFDDQHHPYYYDGYYNYTVPWICFFSGPVSASVRLWHFVIRHIEPVSLFITAVASFAIAIFTRTLWRATTEHGRITSAILKLSEDEFNATHRPLLRVRHFRRVRLGEISSKMIFSIVNVGNGTAWIVESFIDTDYFAPKKLPILDYLGINARFDEIEITAGDSQEIDIDAGWSPHIAAFRLPNILHVYGRLLYRDKLGNFRRTAFCRQWDEERDRFITVEDPDYEYED